MSKREFKDRPDWFTAEDRVDELQDAVLRVHDLLQQAVEVDPQKKGSEFPYARAFGELTGIAGRALSVLEIYSGMVRDEEQSDAA